MAVGPSHAGADVSLAAIRWLAAAGAMLVSKVQVNSQGKVSVGLKVQSGTKEWLGGVMLVPLVTAALEWAGWSR